MTHRNRMLFTGRPRRHSLIKILFAIILFFILCGIVLADPPSFKDNLKAPPTFIPEYMAEKENADALHSDGIFAVYAADRAATGENRKNTVTLSQITDKNWSFSVEARSSPVSEPHGNEQRLESMGAILKGELRF